MPRPGPPSPCYPRVGVRRFGERPANARARPRRLCPRELPTPRVPPAERERKSASACPSGVDGGSPCRYSAAIAPQSAPARSCRRTTATMPCIRRIRIASGGSVNWFTCFLIAARSSPSGGSRSARGDRRRREKRRSPGTAYHLIAIRISPSAKSASTASARPAGRYPPARSAALTAAPSPSRTASAIARSTSMRARRRSGPGRSPGSRHGRRGRADSSRDGGRRGHPVAVEQAEMQPEDDLAVAVALRLLGSPHGLEALALDVFGHEHPPSQSRCRPAARG